MAKADRERLEAKKAAVAANEDAILAADKNQLDSNHYHEKEFKNKYINLHKALVADIEETNRDEALQLAKHQAAFNRDNALATAKNIASQINAEAVYKTRCG